MVDEQKTRGSTRRYPTLGPSDADLHTPAEKTAENGTEQSDQ